jgi:thiosulfate reductase cytochrome b subunit
LVRITHWLTTASVGGLFVSGVAILLAHPRLYWGETGTIGMPSLVDLPLPFVFGPSGWGRYLHFLSAWACVLTGVVYVGAGLLTGHVRRHLLPPASDRSWRVVRLSARAHLQPSRIRHDGATAYNVLQRLAYLTIVFVLFPLIIWSGLAMSPALTSVAPIIVTVLGGQQSARTLHFVAAVAVLAFLVVHVAMVALSGFAIRMRAMTIGGARSPEGV